MKRIISLLLALITVLSVPVTASATTPTATATHKGATASYVNAIVESEKLGLIPKEMYPLRYKEAITREEMASLLVKVYEVTMGEAMKLERWQTFADVTEANPYKDYIYKVDYAYIAGETGRDKAYGALFSPKGKVNREQAATLVFNLNRKVGNINKELVEVKYNDASTISKWAEVSTQVMQSEGLITGVGNGNYGPKDIYTVEQSIDLMLKAFKHFHRDAYPEQFILDRIMPRENDYPTGTEWGLTTVNDSQWRNPSIGVMACGGFAALLSESGFGGLHTSTPVRTHEDFNNIRLGDVLNYNNGNKTVDPRHEVVVIGIGADGTLTIAEGNGPGGIVIWGRTYKPVKGDFVITRYPKRQSKWIDYVAKQDASNPNAPVKPVTPEKKVEEVQDAKLKMLSVKLGADYEIYTKLGIIKEVQEDMKESTSFTDVEKFLEVAYTRYSKLSSDKKAGLTLKEYMLNYLHTFYTVAEVYYPEKTVEYVEGPYAIDYVISTMNKR